MKAFLLLVCLLASACSASHYTAMSLIQREGYPVEFYKTVAEDGYHISAYRIPGKGTPVLFVHGLLCSALGWVANAKDSALPYLFSDAGFDVFIANMRGTTNATAHDTLGEHSKQYWDWSFGERGLYDMPALVNLALNVSGKEKAMLVGHSEGTTESFIALSMVPGFSEKVSLFMALSPVVNVKDTKSWPFVVAKTINLYKLLKSFGVYKICGNNKLVDLIGEEACKLLPDVCDIAFSMIAGWDLDNMDKAREDIYIASGDCTSSKDFGHGFQIANTNELALFDYGSKKKNQEHYGSNTAPVAPVWNITTPIAIFYGGKDLLVVPEDVEKFLIPSLDPTAIAAAPPRRIDHWNHLDFMWSADPMEFHIMVNTAKRFV